MSINEILGIIRHILTAVGTVLVYKGLLDETSWEAIVGSILAIVMVIWSVISKRTNTTVN